MGDQYVIQIDHATLERLLGEYTALVDELDRRRGFYQWGSGGKDVILSLKQPFLLNLGGGDFVEAGRLGTALDTLRQGLVKRLDHVHGHSTAIRWGLQYLLDDSQATEDGHLKTMKAGEFSSYFPAASGGAAGSTPPAS
jgi:hypothetical protein